MHIYYVVPYVIPSQAAHSIHVMKMCNGLAESGCEVTLLLPDYKSKREVIEVDNIYEFYGIKNSFTIEYLPLSFIKGYKLFFPITVLKYLSKKPKGLIFTRGVDIASISTLFKYETILELHAPMDKGKGLRKLLRYFLYKSAFLKDIVVISEALKSILLNQKANEAKLIVAHDGSDPSKTDTKIKFDNTVRYQMEAGYVGHLYEGKGVEIIIGIANSLPHVRFHIVGGTDYDIQKWKNISIEKGINNIVFHGYVSQKQVSEYINAFDVCLLPNQRIVKVWGNSGRNISEYTSPLKMFDYMAHGKAIVASDLPVLREVLTEDNALLCDPDDPDAWISSLNLLINDEKKRIQLGINGLKIFSDNYTWKIRAQHILSVAGFGI